MNKQPLDVLIIGAGFSGLYMLYKARENGLSARVLEAGDNVGGTWYWNRYPGARCDIESIEYSYEFDKKIEQEWDWRERYSAQPEILRYLEYVAEQHDLRSGIQFKARVTRAEFDDARNLWTVTTEAGDSHTSTYLIAATGLLSTPLEPKFEGMDLFSGETYHTGRWPHHAVDFSGKRVAVIGTGSSGLQSIPEIARQASRLTVYQRTPAYAVPAWNRDLTKEELARFRADYDRLRERARQLFFAGGATWPISEVPMSQHPPEKRREMMELAYRLGGLAPLVVYPDLLIDPQSNREMADFLREKIAARVTDPQVAAKLMPQGIVGAKRLCSETGYYETFNRDNVSLVDVRETPIERFTATGIRTTAGEETYDAVVFATGFDAMTGTLNRMEIRGLGGVTLREKWQEGPATYLGLMVSGFPNFFMDVAGPGTSAAFTNVVKSVETSTEWIAGCLTFMRDQGKNRIQATPEAEKAWTEHVAQVADMTLFNQAESWYRGANVPGKKKQFLPYVGGYPVYNQRCAEVARNGYEGFALS